MFIRNDCDGAHSTVPRSRENLSSFRTVVSFSLAFRA
jgi:hypothetical protein